MWLPVPHRHLLASLLSAWSCACFLVCFSLTPLTSAQNPSKVEVRGHLTFEVHSQAKSVPAVLWLDTLDAQPPPSPPHGHYTLLQKNRHFDPHLLVVPVGSAVVFPNADPFFHNVFSLFDGKRFDLGLYEAGSSKIVHFDREGISYIFCNIHPEMSAVVVVLQTSLYAIASADGSFALGGVPPGDYMVHVWVEGEAQSDLDALTHRVHVAGSLVDLGAERLPQRALDVREHTNEFGQPYKPQPTSPY